VRDHAQQRADQRSHDARGSRAGRAALLLLVVGLRLPGHEARRAGDDRGRGSARKPGQRIWVGEALFGAHVAGVRTAPWHAGADCPLPELLRPGGHLDRGPREGACCDVPQGG